MTRRKFFNLIPAICAGAATFTLWPRKASGMFPCRIEKVDGVSGDAATRAAVEVVRVTKDEACRHLYPWEDRFELLEEYYEQGYHVRFAGIDPFTTADGQISFKQALVEAWPAPEGIHPMMRKFGKMIGDLLRASAEAKRAIEAIKLEAVSA